MRTIPPVPPRNAQTPDASGLRPLNVIAAAAKGGVPQARIRRVLADVAESLAPLHARGVVHGGIAMTTVGLDATGKAHVLTPPLEPRADAEGAARINGYAAFEQYTDDPDWPCGPWTDIYALSALAHAMVVGAAPPAALDRCVKDTSAPLASRDMGGYDPEFLQAVDLGLSMVPSARPATLAAFGLAFGLPTLASQASPDVTPVAVPLAPQVVPEIIAQEPAAGAHLPPVAPPPSPKAGPRVPLLMLLGLLAAVALAVYVWVRPEGVLTASPVRDVAPAIPPSAPEPAPAVPTPPALSDLGRTRLGNDTTHANGVNSTSGTSSASGATGANSPTAPLDNPAAPEQPTALGAAPSNPTVTGGSDTPTPELPPSSVSAPPPGGAATTLPDAGASPTSTPSSPDVPAAGANGVDVNAQAPEQGDQPEEEAKPTPPTPAQYAVGVSVRPWGEVIIDGRSRGISPPLGQVMLAPGTHSVVIRNPGSADYRTSVTVGPNRAGSISHVFD